MKRFATHRVYSLLTAEIKSSQVLELDEDGGVSKLYPFREEICATEWLPGLVILSPVPVQRVNTECFSDFRRRMQEAVFTHAVLRAYWVHPFNVSAMEFVKDSRILPLK